MSFRTINYAHFVYSTGNSMEHNTKYNFECWTFIGKDWWNVCIGIGYSTQQSLICKNQAKRGYVQNILDPFLEPKVQSSIKKLEFRRIWRRRHGRRFIFECWFRSKILVCLTIINLPFRCNGYNDAGRCREWGRRWWWRWIRFDLKFLVYHINEFLLYQFPSPQYIQANIPYHAIRSHSRSLFKWLNDISDF